MQNAIFQTLLNIFVAGLAVAAWLAVAYFALILLYILRPDKD